MELTEEAWQFGLRFTDLPEQGSDEEPGLLGRRTQEAIVPDPYEAFGQNMKQPSSDELMGCQGHYSFFACVAVGPADAHFSIPGVP